MIHANVKPRDEHDVSAHALMLAVTNLPYSFCNTSAWT